MHMHNMDDNNLFVVICHLRHHILLALLGVPLNRGTSRRVIVGYEGCILLVCLITKLLYFAHINHNPMNSNPKYATSCRDPLLKMSEM